MQGRIPAPKKHPKKGSGATGAATTNHVLCWEKGRAAGAASLRGQELQEPRSRGAAAVKRFDPALKRQKKYKRKACKAEITARQLQPRPLPGFGVAQARPKGWGKAGLVPLAGDSQGNPAGGFFFFTTTRHRARRRGVKF